MDFYSYLRPALFRLPPELAHHFAFLALQKGWVRPAPIMRNPMLETELFGLHFPNPVGLAAGFDKDAKAVNALHAQGFGFIEVGTVTPKPQAGNPKPRLFRLVEDEAIINRMGFNGAGMDAVLAQLKADKTNGILGINIGKNKDSAEAGDDYIQLLNAFCPYASYITVNISSPNTPGLRDLQKRESLDALLKIIVRHRNDIGSHSGKYTPLLLKIAPDLSFQEKEDIAQLALTHKLDGLIISNTTVSRSLDLRNALKEEQGGLSGKPLFTLSTQTLAEMYRLTQGAIPLIGVGGIASAEDAYVKIRCGASLVQLYSALIYQGFGLVERINRGVVALLERDGFSHIREAVGVDVK